MDSIRDQRNQPSQPTSKYAREHPLVPESCVFAATFVALPSTLPEPAAPLLPFKSENAMSKALSIAEIVLLIQKQLDRPSLLASLQVNRSWNVIGQHLVWESVLWENTLEDEVQNKMVEHLGRIRELRCSFNAQADSSPCRLNSSKLLRLVLGYHQGLAVSHSRDHSSIGPETGKDSEWHQFSPPPHSLSCNTPSSVRRPLQHSSVLHKGQGVDSPIIAAQTPTTSKLRLRRLHLEGYFDLQQTLNNSNINAIHEYRHLIGSGPRLTRGLATLVSFSIPSLTRLVISPAVDIAVDIHLVLDSAIGLEYLTIRSHGSFVDSTIPARLLDQYDQEQEPIEEAIEYRPRSYPAHWTLKSLKIQHLKISQEDLEQVMARCPNLIEFYSLSSPGALWRQRAVHGAAGLLPPLVIPPTDNLTQQHTHPSLQSLSIPLSASQLSLVGSIARSCPKIEKFHVGLQHGGLHLDSIREIMSLFPRLDSLGIPAWDCSKAAMESIKQAQTKAVGSTSATLARPAWSLRSLHHPSAQAPPTTTTATVLRLGHEQGRFLTSLYITNVCSSEKVSLAIHDFLCWTPYLKEFCAYNTTLYVEQMMDTHDHEPHSSPEQQQQQQQQQQQPLPGDSDGWRVGRGGDGVMDSMDILGAHGAYDALVADSGISTSLSVFSPAPHASPSSSLTDLSLVEQKLLSSSPSPSSSSSSSPYLSCPRSPSTSVPTATQVSSTYPTSTSASIAMTTTTTCATRSRQWACTSLEKLVVRFARLPWRNLSEPPKRNPEAFAFLRRLQKLQRLCIKEGLVLDKGREYDGLKDLLALEEVVFTTCYPVPLKPRDMESWLEIGERDGGEGRGGEDEEGVRRLSKLKSVRIRRSKANKASDEVMEAWFRERVPQVGFSLEVVDCCEEDFSF